MSIPKSYISPQSQPWARWVTDTIRSILNKIDKFDIDTFNSIRQLNIAIPQPMRGAISRQTSGTVAIATTDTYVPINLAGTLDTDASFNMVASGAPNVTGLKNNTNQRRTMVFIATYDGKGGNNEAIGLKLALNGVPLDETECTSFGGSTGQVAKTMTQWIMNVEPGDEVTMWAANKDTSVDLTIDRFKLIAHAIP